MAEGLRRNPPEQGTTPETSNPDKMNSSQSPNQGGNLNEGEVTPGQPPRRELGAGAVDYGSEQTVKDLIDHELLKENNKLLPGWIRLYESVIRLWDYLKDFTEAVLQSPDTNDAHKKSLEECLKNLKKDKNLKTTIGIAFEYMKLFENTQYDIKYYLAKFVAEIADNLEAVVYKIISSEEFSYEEVADFLNFMVELRSVCPDDSESRGRKPESDVDHPIDALSRVLDIAARTLLDKEQQQEQKTK
jgi:hypothetical protein